MLQNGVRWTAFLRQ